jgi:DNA-binding LacI/PurR family transcriptional regulator
MAIGAMRALKEMGLSVPQDVSLVGFDNMEEAAYQEPPLTTVAFSAKEMGKVAALKMFQLIAEENLVQKATTLQAELMERESVRKIN